MRPRTVYVLAAGNERGGAASHLLTLARTVRQRAADRSAAATAAAEAGAATVERRDETVFQFAIAGPGALRDQLLAEHVAVLDLPAGLRAAVAAMARQLRADTSTCLVHAHGPRWNLVAATAAIVAKRPWTSTVHSHPDNDFLGSAWKTSVLPRLNRWALRRARGVFVVNRDFASLFAHQRCRFVPNAVQPLELPQAKTQVALELRHRLGVPATTRLVGTAARLDPVKDLGTLIRAMVHLSNAHLCIAGDGQMRAPWQQLAAELGLQDTVHFLGFVSDVQSFYAGLDVHVLCSRSEGAPTSLLEAGSVYVPNVGTDISGITQMLIDGDTGLTVPVGDAVSLAGAVGRLLSDPALARHVAARFAASVLPAFSPDRMIDAYLAGYDDFLGSGA